MTKNIEDLTNKKVVTINLTTPILKAIDNLKKTGLIPSRSDAVRRMIYFAFPYFLGLHKLIHAIGTQNLEFFSLPKSEIPKPKINLKELKTLRNLFPKMPEYKFMNEE